MYLKGRGINMGDVIGYLIFWVIAFIVFAVSEAISVRLIAIWFAVGAIAAFIAALTKRFVHQNYEGSNANCLIGKIGIVIEMIDNQRARGRVSVNGAEWAARSCDDTVIAIDEKVTIESIDGVKAMVTKRNPQKLPEN